MRGKQLDFYDCKSWGGRRKGAGRPRIHKGAQLHLKRPELNPRHPLHVTIKLNSGLPKLRQKKYFKALAKAMLKAKAKGLRVVHFSVQSNHVHLIVESPEKRTLSRGMQSLTTSLAKRINSLVGRSGAVLRDRYHAHALKTPSEVKRALTYVFQNWAKHSKRKWSFDPYSTLLCFEQKVLLGLGRVNTHSTFTSTDERTLLRKELLGMISKPRSWLLTTGWKRAAG